MIILVQLLKASFNTLPDNLYSLDNQSLKLSAFHIFLKQCFLVFIRKGGNRIRPFC